MLPIDSRRYSRFYSNHYFWAQLVTAKKNTLPLSRCHYLPHYSVDKRYSLAWSWVSLRHFGEMGKFCSRADKPLSYRPSKSNTLVIHLAQADLPNRCHTGRSLVFEGDGLDIALLWKTRHSHAAVEATYFCSPIILFTLTAFDFLFFD